MIWKLVVFIIILIIALLFIGANLGNACTISLFWFAEIKDVPIFMSILIAFLLGVIATLPFVIFKKTKSPKTASTKEANNFAKKNNKKGEPPEVQANQNIVYNNENSSDKKATNTSDSNIASPAENVEAGANSTNVHKKKFSIFKKK